MISLIQGRVVEKTPESVIVDAGGVGYEVFVPAGVLLEVGATGDVVRLRTHLDVKEDSLTLFGFLTRDQLDMFRMLTSVARVGSRVALTVLSVLEVDAIAAAVIGGDHAAFDAVPGIGKKLAQRIVLELAEKVGKRWPVTSVAPASVAAKASAGGAWELARDALLSQGFKAPEVEDRLRWARAKVGDDGRVGDIVREALRFGG